MLEIPRKKPLTLVICVFVLICAAWGTLHFRSKAAALAATQTIDDVRPLAVVDVQRVSPSARPLIFVARGVVTGSQEVTVSSEVSGKVIEKPIRDGQPIKAGDVICRIDPTFHRLAVQAADAELRQTQAAYDNAEAEVTRILDVNPDYKTDIEYNRFITARDQAKAAHDAAESQLEQATEKLQRCTIVSPIDGVVSGTLFEVGELLGPAHPVAEVVQLDHLKLVVEVMDYESAHLDDAASITVTSRTAPGSVFAGTIQAIYPKANPLTRRVPVEIQVQNRDGLLRSGTFASCTIECSQGQETVLIPAKGVQSRFLSSYCYVVAQGNKGRTIERRTVVTESLPDSVSHVRVLDGLSEGDLLVVSSLQELQVGQEVATRLLTASAQDTPDQ